MNEELMANALTGYVTAETLYRYLLKKGAIDKQEFTELQKAVLQELAVQIPELAKAIERSATLDEG